LTVALMVGLSHCDSWRRRRAFWERCTLQTNTGWWDILSARRDVPCSWWGCCWLVSADGKSFL